MNDRNDDVTINGRSERDDEVIDPRAVSRGQPARQGLPPRQTPPTPPRNAVPPPDSPGVVPPLAAPTDEAVEIIAVSPTDPLNQKTIPPQAPLPSASQMIREDIAQTNGLSAPPPITNVPPANNPPPNPQAGKGNSLPEKVSEEAMGKAQDVTSSVGTTAGQLLGQAMEIGSAAEHGARALGELVQHQASEIVRQAQDRFGMLESRAGSTAESATSAAQGATSPKRMLRKARVTAKRVGRKLPFEVNLVVVALLGAVLAAVTAGAIFLLLRRHEVTHEEEKQVSTTVVPTSAERTTYTETLTFEPEAQRGIPEGGTDLPSGGPIRRYEVWKSREKQ